MELLGPGQIFQITITHTFIVKYGEVMLLSSIRRKAKAWKTWGRHNNGIWETLHHFLPSPVSPISAPCVGENYCWLKMNTRWSGWLAFRSQVVIKNVPSFKTVKSQCGELFPKNHMVLKEVTVPGVHSPFLQLLFLHLLREENISSSLPTSDAF